MDSATFSKLILIDFFTNRTNSLVLPILSIFLLLSHANSQYHLKDSAILKKIDHTFSNFKTNSPVFSHTPKKVNLHFNYSNHFASLCFPVLKVFSFIFLRNFVICLYPHWSFQSIYPTKWSSFETNGRYSKYLLTPR
jgi:hypothetical protein